MFKFFTLVLILATLAALQAERANVNEADHKCQANFDVTDKEIDDLFHVLTDDTDGIDRKFKCYFKCIMDELNYKDENGKMDFKRIVGANRNHRGHPRAVHLATNCEEKHDQETDECERTFKIFACITLALKSYRREH